VRATPQGWQAADFKPDKGPYCCDEAAAYVSRPAGPQVTWQVASHSTVPRDAVKQFRSAHPGIVVDQLFAASLLAILQGSSQIVVRAPALLCETGSPRLGYAVATGRSVRGRSAARRMC
jgi:hypothetical protein